MKIKNAKFPRGLALLPIIAASVLLASNAGATTWDGGDIDDNLWTSADNWDTPLTAGDSLVFAGSTRLAPNNDFTGLTTFGAITFASGAGAFTLGGNSITLGGNITNSSSNDQTIDFDMALDADRSFTAGATGIDIVVNGVISGAFNLSASAANGTLILNGANTFSGVLSATGFVKLGHENAAANATLGVSASNNGFKFSSSAGGNFNVAHLANTKIIDLRDDLGQAITITIGGAGAATQSGVLTGTGGLIISGGTQTLSGATNSFSGGVVVNAGGTVIGTVNAALGLASGTGGLTVNSGGAVEFSGTATAPTLPFINGTGGTITANNGAATTLYINTATSNGSYAGVLQETGGSTLALYKYGAGTQTLTGTNTYSGSTRIAAGVLQANDGAGLSSNSFLILDTGVLQSNGTASFTRSLGAAGGGAFRFNTPGGGFSANGGQLTVNVDGAVTPTELGWSTSGNVIIGTLKFGSTTADAKTLFQNGINLNNAARTIDVALGTGGDSAEISGVIRSTTSASGSLIKTGAGTLALSGVNTYTGATTVNAGTLIIGVAGTGSLASAVTVTAGTLGGSGSTTGNVAIGNSAGGSDSFIAPGNSDAGTFTTTGSLSLLSDATYAFELNGTNGSVAADQLISNGVTIDSSAIFQFTLLGNKSGLHVNDVFTIIDNTGVGSISGPFSNLANGSTFVAPTDSALTFAVSYSGGTGNDLVLTVATVPESSSVILASLGLAALLYRARHRRSQISSGSWPDGN